MASVIIAAMRFTFITPPTGSSSKAEAQKIKDRLWSKFKIAVAELGNEEEVTGSGVAQVLIGATFVGTSEKDCRRRADQIVKHLNEWGAVELVNDEVELIRFEDIELEKDFEKYNP